MILNADLIDVRLEFAKEDRTASPAMIMKIATTSSTANSRMNSLSCRSAKDSCLHMSLVPKHLSARTISIAGTPSSTPKI